MEVIITPDDDWFQNPLDKMPIAKDSAKTFDWEDTAPSEYEPPRPEEEIAALLENPDDSDQIESEKTYQSRHKSTPDHEKSAEEVVTMHEQMYRMATKNGGSWLGGSENLHGGSEKIVK